MNDEVKIPQLTYGTRILTGNLASRRRDLIDTFFDITTKEQNFNEIVLPTIEKSSIYKDKAGNEILDQMYSVSNRKDTEELCLRPEGTATCQLIANQYKFDKDVRIAYECRCFRVENTRAGRYCEFTQLGVEILNPRKDYLDELISLAKTIVAAMDIDLNNIQINTSAKRGLAYYTGDGFEFNCPSLGRENQILGGGRYKEGIGFAIGLDRILLIGK